MVRLTAVSCGRAVTFNHTLGDCLWYVKGGAGFPTCYFVERLTRGVFPPSCRRAVIVRVSVFYTRICCWSLSRHWTGLLLLEREEEQEDAESLKDRALAGLGSQGKEHTEGHWAARASRGSPQGTEAEGPIRGGHRWVRYTLLPPCV